MSIRCGSDLGGLGVEREHAKDQCPRLSLMLGRAGLGWAGLRWAELRWGGVRRVEPRLHDPGLTALGSQSWTRGLGSRLTAHGRRPPGSGSPGLTARAPGRARGPGSQPWAHGRGLPVRFTPLGSLLGSQPWVGSILPRGSLI